MLATGKQPGPKKTTVISSYIYIRWYWVYQDNIRWYTITFSIKIDHSGNPKEHLWMQTSFVCFFSSTPGSWHDRHVSGSDPHLRMILAQLYRFDSSAVWSWDVGCIGYMGSIVDRPIDPSGSDSWNSNSLLPTEVCQRMASTKIEDDRSSKNTRCIFSRILVTIVSFPQSLVPCRHLHA